MNFKKKLSQICDKMKNKIKLSQKCCNNFL